MLESRIDTSDMKSCMLDRYVCSFRLARDLSDLATIDYRSRRSEVNKAPSPARGWCCIPDRPTPEAGIRAGHESAPDEHGDKLVTTLAIRRVWRAGGRRVQVEVPIHARLNVAGSLVLGDLVYSTTLARGRRCTSERFRIVARASVSIVKARSATVTSRPQRNAITSSSMHDFMSDVSIRDSSIASSTTPVRRVAMGNQ